MPSMIAKLLLLVIPSFTVNVDLKDVEQTTQTLTFSEVSVSGLVLESDPELVSESKATIKIAVITVTSPYDGVIVRSRTCKPEYVKDKTWIVREPGRHWVRVVTHGIADGESQYDEKELEIVIPGKVEVKKPAAVKKPQTTAGASKGTKLYQPVPYYQNPFVAGSPVET